MKTAKHRSPKGKPMVDPLAAEGNDWVVVNGCGRNQGRGDEKLHLKKQAWLMRICQRKTAGTVACQLEDLGEEMDAETVEALCSEVEVLRASLGMHWTWFQEELVAGRYDAQLSGEASDGHSLENVLLPPSADATLAAYPAMDASVAKVCRNRRLPNSSARSTPKMHSKQSPQSGPRSPQVEKKLEIPPEVWIAAEKHRKSNFFAAALLESPEASSAFIALITFMEVSEVLGLALASAAFCASLLKEQLWRLLGSRGTCPGFATDRFVAFASDPAFRCHIWARQQRFVDRLLRGLTKTAVVLPSVQDLGGPGTRLGPFLPPSASSRTGCARLVVCDGKQTCRVVDVERLREEQVEIDRYCSKRLLRSSVGTHPVAVTTSWPLNEVSHCCAGGGIVAARPAPTTGILPRSSPTVQWLELPEFGLPSHGLAEGSEPDDGKAAHRICSSPAVKPRSPSLASAKTSPVLSRQKSPTMKASPVSGAQKDDFAPLLARMSVLQEQLLAALPDVNEAAPACVVVEGAWPLRRSQVLLTVREVIASSPSIGPLKSPQFRASTSPKGLLAEAMRTTGAPLAPFELPPQAGPQTPKAEDQVCQGLRRWLQVWDLVPDQLCKEVAPEPHACMAVASQVTCVDTLTIASDGGEVALLLCGSRGGTVFLQCLDEVPETRASWSVEANFGIINQVLLRSRHHQETGNIFVVVAQEHGVFLGTANVKTRQPSAALAKLLPSKAIASSLNVACLQPVGACGFAVCSPKHVYAFEVESGNAAMVAVVELPGIPVRHFCATPYEFFVVLAGECSQKRRTVCCLWPTLGEEKATRTCASAVNLHARVRGSETAQLQDTMAVAVDLSKALMHGAAIDTLALNAVLPGQAGSGLLAVQGVGSGVSVFRWGMEVNPDLEKVRELRADCMAQQAHEHHLESLRRHLQRLRQRLQETEKLEEKAQTKGGEALTEEETAKIQRRGQVEGEIERLTHELGLDTGSQEEEEEIDPQEERDMEIARQRREKERVQRRHHEEKRAMQKERRQNRDRKFSD